MKRFLSYLVLLGILLQCFSSFLVVANFQWNRAQITNSFCENKSKPKLHCNGKCHLRKQLKAQEKREQNPAAPLKLKNDELQFFEQLSCFIPSNFFSTNSRLGFITTIGAEQQVVRSVFHPPCLKPYIG